MTTKPVATRGKGRSERGVKDAAFTDKGGRGGYVTRGRGNASPQFIVTFKN
jgi:hypothetical protein